MRYDLIYVLAISSFLLGCATSHKAITTQRAIEDLYERQDQLEAKIDKISEDMKALRGDIQPLNRAIEQSYSKLEKRIENLEKRKTSRGYQSAASANSLYSTAESYYRDKQFKEAILAYQRFIANYPRDKRVPLSYLKQGLSLISIGKKDEAKYFFQTLIDKFPNSEEAKAAQEKLRQIDQSS
jgi:TolA-binding protein